MKRFLILALAALIATACSEDTNATNTNPGGDITPGGDTTPDNKDLCPNDPDKTEPGSCGCGTPDTDSDKDGTPDCIDQCPNDHNKIHPLFCGCGSPDTDSDGDGTPDCIDQCPNDPNKIHPLFCGCGTPDTDSDKDGTPDCIDQCPNDHNKTEPGSCGCGTPDTDSDGDGTPDCFDQCPNDHNKTEPGSCGCGTPDTDSDGDGTPDCFDSCPNDPKKNEPGSCGCGMPDTDSDGDGTPDCFDKCLNDPNKTEPGSCGCNVGEITLENGQTDCLETDGLLQVDYSLAHSFNLITGETPEEQESANDKAFKSRKTPTSKVRLAFMPAGNLVSTSTPINSNSYSGGCDTTKNNYARVGLEEMSVARPFAAYPVIETGCDPDLWMTVTRPHVTETTDFCWGVFAKGTIYYYRDNSLTSIKDGSEFEKNAPDGEQFKFYGTCDTYKKDDDRVTTLKWRISDGDEWAGFYGPKLQYLSAYVGKREIRFSNDGKQWTEWQTFDFTNRDGWHIDHWDLTDPTYGGTANYGKKTVYMQTHDLLTDTYYQTSDTIEYVKPETGGKVSIGSFTIPTDKTSREDVLMSVENRLCTETLQDIHFIPGGNLLTTLDNAENGATTADDWILSKASIQWQGNGKTRHIASSPVAGIGEYGYISQYVEDLKSLITNSEERKTITATLAVYNGNATVEVRVQNAENDTDVYKIFKSANSNAGDFQIYKIAKNNEDVKEWNETKYSVYTDSNATVSDPYLNFGKIYVRFSFDNKETWTTWYNINNEERNYPSAESEHLDSIRNGLVYPNAQLIPADGKVSVYMQTYLPRTDTFYEASEEISYTGK